MPNEKTKIFKAKFPYTCLLCNKEHPEGTRSLYEGAKLLAADCKWPDKAGKKIQANPESSKPAAPTKAAETTVGVSKVEGRLILAKQMVKDIIPNAEEYQDYLSMITEIVHQLGSEEWLELEKMKLRGR